MKFVNNEICSIFTIDSLVFYVWDQNFDFFEKNGSILDQYFICLRVFLGQITTKNLSLRSWEITKKSFRRKLLKIFHFFTLWIWLFGIFDKRPQGCDEVKNSMGLLQGPRLMAWTTKSPILENHWVPWGCMAHLGSVKMMKFDALVAFWLITLPARAMPKKGWFHNNKPILHMKQKPQEIHFVTYCSLGYHLLQLELKFTFNLVAITTFVAVGT